jgi:hypothetical protein
MAAQPARHRERPYAVPPPASDYEWPAAPAAHVSGPPWVDVNFGAILTGTCHYPLAADCSGIVSAVYTTGEVEIKIDGLSRQLQAIDGKYNMAVQAVQTDQTKLRTDITGQIGNLITREIIKQIKDDAVKEAKRQITDTLCAQGSYPICPSQH